MPLRFTEGMEQLLDDAWWSWLNRNWESCSRVRGVTQQTVAKMCGLGADAFGKFLNRSGDTPRSITLRAATKLSVGLQRMSQLHNFEYHPLAFPNPQDLAVAGWVNALNYAGGPTVAPGNRGRPVGVLHFYCLRMMCFQKEVFEALAVHGRSDEWEQLAQRLYREAQKFRAGVATELLAFRNAETEYPLRATHESMRELRKAWIDPWRIVYHSMGGYSP